MVNISKRETALYSKKLKFSSLYFSTYFLTLENYIEKIEVKLAK